MDEQPLNAHGLMWSAILGSPAIAIYLQKRTVWISSWKQEPTFDYTGCVSRYANPPCLVGAIRCTK